MRGLLQVGEKIKSVETWMEAAHGLLDVTGSCPLRTEAPSCVPWMTPMITSCLCGTGRRRSSWRRSRCPEGPRSRLCWRHRAAELTVAVLQCSNDSVLAAVFHPLDDSLIVTCGKSHINFWTMDSNTLVKKQGLFEVRPQAPSGASHQAFLAV